MTLWLVRCGKYGEGEEISQSASVVGTGWPEAGDLTKVSTSEGIKDRLQMSYPEAKTSTIANWAGQIDAFHHRIEKGDLVAVPLKATPAINFGRVVGDAFYAVDGPDSMRSQRRVEWVALNVPRSEIDRDILYSFGAFMTVCQIKRNDAEKRILNLLSSLKKNSELPAGPTPPGGPAPAIPDDKDSPVDIGEISRDQIRSRITERFHGHAMARLVGALLEADDFVVQVSPAGPDGGVDILAGQGGMGFEGTKIVVQVKSGSVVSDASVLRELQGVMSNFGASHGLLVSWGGFTGVARSEARRLFFKIRLWDSNNVIEQVERLYDSLPSELQAELPMKKIWTLASDEQ